MASNFEILIHWSWFKHQDLRHTDVEERVNLSSILRNESYFITIIY